MILFLISIVLLFQDEVQVHAFDCEKNINANRSLLNCCKIPSLYPTDVIKKCKNLYEENTMKEMARNLPGPKRGDCVSECLTFKIGVNPNQDGNIDYNGFKNYLDSVEINESWKSLVVSAVETCYLTTNQIAEDLKISFALHPAFKAERICHPFSGTFISCIFAKMISSCPNHDWNSNPDCEEIKNFAKSCEVSPLQFL